MQSILLSYCIRTDFSYFNFVFTWFCIDIVYFILLYFCNSIILRKLKFFKISKKIYLVF